MVLDCYSDVNEGEGLGLGVTQAKFSESDGFTWLPEVRAPLQTAHFYISEAKAR